MMEIEIKCQKCDADLVHELKERRRAYRTDWVIEVEPCVKCIEEAEEKAREEAAA